MSHRNLNKRYRKASKRSKRSQNENKETTKELLRLHAEFVRREKETSFENNEKDLDGEE